MNKAGGGDGIPTELFQILKEISPEYSLEGLMLKLQYFGYLMQRTNYLFQLEHLDVHLLLKPHLENFEHYFTSM